MCKLLLNLNYGIDLFDYLDMVIVVHHRHPAMAVVITILVAVHPNHHPHHRHHHPAVMEMATVDMVMAVVAEHRRNQVHQVVAMGGLQMDKAEVRASIMFSFSFQIIRRRDVYKSRLRSKAKIKRCAVFLIIHFLLSENWSEFHQK